MTESLTITTEYVDDIPLLIAQLEHMDLPALLDGHSHTNGNWTDLSLSLTTAIWLVYILSKADHCMNYVQPWVECRIQALCITTGQVLASLDWADNRSAAILRQFSNNQHCHVCDMALSQHLIRIYDVAQARLCLHATTVTAQHLVTKDDLFQLSLSKDHHSDLHQFKLMLAIFAP